MAGNLAVGDAYRDPNRPLAPGTGSDHLQDPCLLGVGDGERLAFVAVAILGDQAGHHLDGLPGGARPLQGQSHQRRAIDQPRRIVQLLPAAEGRLTDGKLVLVHQAQHLVGVSDLGNLAGRPLVFRSARFNGDRFARLVVGGGSQRQGRIQAGIIATVGDHHRAVGRRPAGDDNARAGFGGRATRQSCQPHNGSQARRRW